MMMQPAIIHASSSSKRSIMAKTYIYSDECLHSHRALDLQHTVIIHHMAISERAGCARHGITIHHVANEVGDVK